MSTKLQNKLNKMVDNKSLDSEEVARFIKKEFDYDITGTQGKEDKAWYRQYLKRGVQEAPIRVITPTVNIEYDFTRKKVPGPGGAYWKNFKDATVSDIRELNPLSPQNLARNRKTVRVPILDIENVYKKLMSEQGKDIDISTTEGRPLTLSLIHI